MHPVLECLVRAEETWRETVRTEFPVFANMPVVHAEPDPKHDRHWQFYTDGSTIHTDVLKPEEVEQVVREAVLDRYRGAYGTPIADDDTLLRRLVHDTLTYLHFHETFHPAITPDSKEDEQAFDKALFEGLRKAEPQLAEADALRKLGNVRNAMWDIVIDNAFFVMSNYGNNLERRLRKVLREKRGIDLAQLNGLPDGVVPIFDVMEIHRGAKVTRHGKQTESLFYPITRLMYGILFAESPDMRGKLAEFFSESLKSSLKPAELQAAITDSVKGVVREFDAAQVRLSRVNRQQYEAAVDQLWVQHGDATANAAHTVVVETLAKVTLDKRTRYAAIRGMIQPLAKYVSLSREEKRHGTHIGPASGGGSSSPNQSGGNTLQSLLNLSQVLDNPQANQLLSAIANNPGGSQAGEDIKTQQLGDLATDEYYKRNAKDIPIRSPRQEATKVDLGKLQRWVRVQTLYLAQTDLHNLPLERIMDFQQQTGITQLFDLGQEWQYDIYELQETAEFDFTFESKGLELPDNIVFHLDSSESMGTPKYVGTGCKYDQLMHVVYGILKTMRKASGEMKKPVNVVTANFSAGTIVSDKPAELSYFYDTPSNPAKRVLLGFQNGGTVYDVTKFPEIKKQLVPGKTVHVWVSDGDLEGSNVNPTYQAVTQLVQDPCTTFLMFEMGGTSSFGGKIKQLGAQRPNVKHYPVSDLKQVQSGTLEVVLQYDDGGRYRVEKP